MNKFVFPRRVVASRVFRAVTGHRERGTRRPS